MFNFTTFATAKDFYQFWDAQDHTTHSRCDFAFRAIILSILHEETEDQCVKRLMRTFPPVNDGKPNRYKYDTLRRLMGDLAFLGRYANENAWTGSVKPLYYGKFAPFIKKPESFPHASLRVLFESLASKVAAANAPLAKAS
jgi:hypothetical protein